MSLHIIVKSGCQDISDDPQKSDFTVLIKYNTYQIRSFALCLKHGSGDNKKHFFEYFLSYWLTHDFFYF